MCTLIFIFVHSSNHRQKQGRQAEMDIRQTNMKFTDQIERELVQRVTTVVPDGGLNNAASGLNYNGAWLTAVMVAAAALVWMLYGT